MRYERSVTSISWIPSEAMSAPMRVPMDLGIGHYDPPPPDQLDADVLEELREGDRFRFANRLGAWVDVVDDEIVAAGYDGGGIVGSTTARLGLSVTIPGVAFPLLQDEPMIEGRSARFVQTAGGRTGAPSPANRPSPVRQDHRTHGRGRRSDSPSTPTGWQFSMSSALHHSRAIGSTATTVSSRRRAV